MSSPFGKLVSGLRSASTFGRKRAGSPGADSGGPPGGGGGGRVSAGAAQYGVLVGGHSTEDELEAALNDLPPGYFEPPELFDALEHELRQLPVGFDAAQLESVAEQRTGVLETVSERLSTHVIHNYDKFVAGVGEVTLVEGEVQAAHVTAKRARESLALAQKEVLSNLRIAQDTRRKQGLTALLEALLRLQQANNLQRALKEAQEEGEFAEAFFLCAQCIRSMEELGEGLHVAQQLTATINRLYGETTQRLESALAAVCSDFRPAHYTKVLEGYMFLGDVAALGGEVQAAFVATLSSSVTKVVRGVLLTRPGCEEQAGAAQGLQDLLRLLPSDLFRTCLARALMVVFDVLASHLHMVRWHQAALDRHAADLAALQAQRRALADRVGGDGSDVVGNCDSAAGQQLADGAEEGLPAAGRDCSDEAAAAAEEEQVEGGELAACGSEGEVAVRGRAALGLRRGTASELEEVEARASDEAEWGLVLRAVLSGLLAGRRLIWEEAARRIGVLLSSPAAFEGEHFLQVMEWTQRLLAAGEAFAGAPCDSLRALLERQSGKFFRLYHHANVEALSSMLDKELWQKLPAELPSLSAALRGRPTSGDERGGGSPGGRSPPASQPGWEGQEGGGDGGGDGDPMAAFERWVVQGNPWRKQGSPRRRRRQHLGFGGSAGTDDSRGGLLLEVDEYGVPRTASNTPLPATSGGAARPGSAQSESATDTDAEDALGDPIDVDAPDQQQQQQQQQQQPQQRNGGGGGDGADAVTNSSWRMFKWMRDYAALMRPLGAAAPAIFAGLCELFELYLLHVFVAFSDVSLAEVQQQQQQQAAASNGGGLPAGGGGGGATDALTPRLRGTVLRIAGDSIGKYRQLFAAQPGSKLVRALGSAGAAASPPAAGGKAAAAGGAAPPQPSAASQYFRRTLPGSGPSSLAAAAAQQGPPGGVPRGAGAANGLPPSAAGAPSPASAAGMPAAAAEISAASHPGNLYGLLGRAAAADSLLAVAAQLRAARPLLAAALPPEGAAAADAFFSRTLGAAEDLRGFIMRAAARLLLPLRWLPERLGAASWVLAEPPTGHGAWVDELRRQLELLRDRLEQVPGLDAAAARCLWGAAAAHVGEAVLEGLSRARKCSLEGRAAMSLDLQGVHRALAAVLPRGVAPDLRLADAYVKAFYIPLAELPHWAATHAEYSPAQVLSLVACIAESGGMKKRDKAALLAQVQGHLAALSPGGPPGS